MKQVTLKPLNHRGRENIGIYFQNYSSLNNIIRKLKEVKWSQTNKCWYMPLSSDSYNLIKETLKEIAEINNAELKQYLEKRKQVEATSVPLSTKPVSANFVTKAITASPAWKLSKENLAALEKFVEQLKLKSYSPSTIRTYRNEFLQLLQLLKNKPVAALTADDLRRYIVYAMEKEGIKENTAHSRLNALKFYFEQVLGREKFFWEIPRPKKPQLLPKLLNENEIAKLFNALSNKKHKAILFTAYSSGLRVSEVVNLKLRNIDSKRMQIFCRTVKGEKRPVR